MAKRTPSPAVMGLILAAHLAVTSITWRDLRRRPDSEVRGSKRVWRAASALNTTGSVAYFLLGRRRGV
jgi:hypothetical protein